MNSEYPKLEKYLSMKKIFLRIHLNIKQGGIIQFYFSEEIDDAN